MATIPILTYHSIDSSGSCLSTNPELFAWQMQYLASRQYRTLTVTQAVSYLKHGEEISQPVIALTFDDGYRSVVDHALPILRHYGFMASLFVVSGRCGAENSWDPSQGRFPRLALANEEEIRGCVRAGWEIGAHSATHARLTTLGEEELERELRGCRQFLEECSGQPVRCLAYPYGIHDARIRDRTRTCFDSACTTELAFASRDSDPLALQRIDVYYLRSHGMFRALSSGWMPAYLALRRCLRKVRTW
jgi:peptidoglycan/xylan/chitin deacetylase (PgdA/CDA1 family)